MCHIKCIVTVDGRLPLVTKNGMNRVICKKECLKKIEDILYEWKIEVWFALDVWHSNPYRLDADFLDLKKKKTKKESKNFSLCI